MKPFNYRAFISLSTLVLFIVMTVSGVAVLVSPMGRIAYWTDWHWLGLDKSQWGDIHTIVSFGFVVAGLFHLFYNFKAVKTYVTGRISALAKYRMECVGAVALTAILLAMTIYSVPPVSGFINSTAKLKSPKNLATYEQPPFAHAENASVSSFARRLELDTTLIMNIWQLAGIQINSPQSSLETIAETNNTSPAKLYRILLDAAEHINANRTATFSQLSTQALLSLDFVLDNMESAGITGARANLTVGEVAERNGIDILELVNIALDRNP